jgi:hypothetical protein
MGLSALLAASLLSQTAHADDVDPTQVTGLNIAQHEGFTTVAWTPVPGATDYQIERTPVDENNQATGPAVITGVWRPDRQINNSEPTFADAGFTPGERFQWRVRARLGTTAQAYSAPVFGNTAPSFGDPNKPGEQLRTGWETSAGAQYTTDVDEYAYTAAIAENSDRVRVVEIGRTIKNRPINMFVFGYPAPPATPEAVAATSPVLVNCNVHGNEPGDREACLIMARQLAFSDDQRVIDILKSTTVLIVPTINGDGRAANTRGNSTGQDLNRDYSKISQPETKAFIEMIRDYKPVAAYDGHEYGNATAGDLPMLPPRHANVGQSIFDQSMDMIMGHMFVEGANDGWWPCLYGCIGGGNVGLGEETIVRNSLGLKNITASLLELRSSGGTTRPSESGTAGTTANRKRKTYSALWTFNQLLDYHHAKKAEIVQSRNESIAFQVSNTGPIVFRGSREIQAYPAPHPAQAVPPVDAPTPELTLTDHVWGYELTDEQWNTQLADGAPVGFRTTVGERIQAHGWSYQKTAGGYVVPLAQPERGFIPLLLDEKAVEGIVVAKRLSEGPAGNGEQVITAEVLPGSLSVSFTGTTVTMDAVTLNGFDQVAGGSLNPATVVDARGTAADWSLTGQVSDFVGPNGLIVADNLGWAPTADYVSGQLPSAPGSGPVVAAGAVAAPGAGLGNAKTLCSANPGGGAFQCGAALNLGIPGSTLAGVYTGVLTLTLV